MSLFRAGHVALLGKPNAGKSTLLNALIKERLAVTTSKPQTTRHRIIGIVNRSDAQIAFIDTPGYHRSSKSEQAKALNAAMNDIVTAVAEEVDVICLLIEPATLTDPINRELFSRLNSQKCVVVINKGDLKDKAWFAGAAEELHRAWGAQEIVVVSALEGIGMGELLETIIERLPEGEPLYPMDQYTPQSLRFLVSELIREQVFLQMQQEIPYGTAVVIEEFQEAPVEGGVTRIRASIIVEKPNQKGMVIGGRGARIRELGKQARKGIEELVGGKVFLDLHVRVVPGWSRDPDKIREFEATS